MVCQMEETLAVAYAAHALDGYAVPINKPAKRRSYLKVIGTVLWTTRHMCDSDTSNDDLDVDLWLNKYKTDGQLLFKPKESNAYECYRYNQ